MEQVKVESGIEMPVMKQPVAYPYELMEIGDSFLVSGGGKNVMVSVCARNKRVGGKLGRKFIAKRMEDGVRVWRVS